MNATKLKDVSKEILEKRGNIGFVIDLQECPEIDSTFSGTIAGIALRLREVRSRNAVRLINVRERPRQFLSNLGLGSTAPLRPMAGIGAQMGSLSCGTLGVTRVETPIPSNRNGLFTNRCRARR